jgi:putative transposase
MISFKGLHYQQEMILQCVHWYLAYALSYRNLEEVMQERGFPVDHSTINRWVIHYTPQLNKSLLNKKR